MLPHPRRLLPLTLLGLLLLVAATAAICGGDSGSRDASGDDGDAAPTRTAATAAPIASPQPTEPIPTPVGPTPPGGGVPAGTDYACDRSGPGDRITVRAPSSGASVSSPVTVRGTASVFEATLQVVIRDRTGAQIGGQTVTASEGAPGTGTYEAAIPYTLTGGRQPGCVEVFSASPRDGSIENLVSVPVTLNP